MGYDDLFVLAKSLKFELQENYLFTAVIFFVGLNFFAVTLLQGPQCLFPRKMLSECRYPECHFPTCSIHRVGVILNITIKMSTFIPTVA